MQCADEEDGKASAGGFDLDVEIFSIGTTGSIDCGPEDGFGDDTGLEVWLVLDDDAVGEAVEDSTLGVGEPDEGLLDGSLAVSTCRFL